MIKSLKDYAVAVIGFWDNHPRCAMAILALFLICLISLAR